MIGTTPPAPRRRGAALGALAVSLTVSAAVLAAPAAAVAPGAALTNTAGFGGYSTGTNVFTDVLNSGGDPDLLRLSLSQSAAGVSVGEALVDQDLLGSSILTADEAGKNAYGHGAAANVGIGQAESAPPQVALSTAEALSPPPTVAEPTDLLQLPAGPVATAALLPSTAQAQTVSSSSVCPTGNESLISEGTSQVANAQLLSPGAGQNVVTVGDAALPGDGVSASVSQTGLVAPSGGAAGFGLATVTTQTIAPITLFRGIPGAETTIAVLRDLQLSATATGGTGSEVFYGFVNAAGEPVPDSEEVLRINDTVLTSEDVLGGDGLKLSLGLVDVFIGAPAHGLDDNPLSNPTVTSTNAAAAADFIRITVPGTVPVGSTMPVAADSPLAPVLNPVLQPVIDGLEPVLAGLQDALAAAGLDAADLRIGHFEALASVPAGGIDCGGPDDNPLDESMKDVSVLDVAPGGLFDYDIRIPNRGDAPITNVVVKDTYSADLEFVSSVPPPTSRTGNMLTYELGTLQPNEFRIITLTFRVPTDAVAGTVYRNKALITGTYKGQPIDKPVEVEGPTVGPAPTGGCNLSGSTKFASNTQVVTGQNFGYFVNVLNSGGQPCRNVVVKDTLVDGVSFVSCTAGCTRDGQDLTWDVGTLAAGQGKVLAVVVKVTATSGTLPNRALITSPSGPGGTPSTPGPTVTDTSVPAPGKPASGPDGAGALPGTLPRTGLPLAPSVLALGLLSGALVLARRRTFG